MPAEGAVPFGEYLASATVPDCELPHYYVMHHGITGGAAGEFLDNEAQLQARIESLTQKKGSPLVVYEGADSDCRRDEADIEVYALHMGSELTPLLKKLLDAGISFDALKPGEQGAWSVLAKDKEQPAKSLIDAVATVTEECSNGVEVQRYKGLGEMNPSQLFESTMDPERRVLSRVTVSDMVEADRIFTVLMGPEVEPRRDFIEKHALEATNIDI